MDTPADDPGKLEGIKVPDTDGCASYHVNYSNSRNNACEVALWHTGNMGTYYHLHSEAACAEH